MIERNRARKTWQFTRDPSDKRVLNNIQNRIHRKVKAFHNKIWEDELRVLDPDDGSLWEMSKELRKKKSSVYGLKGQAGSHSQTLTKPRGDCMLLGNSIPRK
ncbi:hypothetical protein TNCV_3150411 [Trichonephila clavipes]|nr:hypothetical protein TNCV_3150411 [Trichonephila clavipes]